MFSLLVLLLITNVSCIPYDINSIQEPVCLGKPFYMYYVKDSTFYVALDSSTNVLKSSVGIKPDIFVQNKMGIVRNVNDVDNSWNVLTDTNQIISWVSIPSSVHAFSFSFVEQYDTFTISINTWQGKKWMTHNINTGLVETKDFFNHKEEEAYRWKIKC